MLTKNLFQISPAPSIKKSVNSWPCDIKKLSELAFGDARSLRLSDFIQSTNLSDLILGELHIMVPLSACGATFPSTIAVVVSSRAKEETSLVIYA